MDIYKYAKEFDTDYTDEKGNVYAVQHYNLELQYGVPTSGIKIYDCNNKFIGIAKQSGTDDTLTSVKALTFLDNCNFSSKNCIERRGLIKLARELYPVEEEYKCAQLTYQKLQKSSGE